MPRIIKAAVLGSSVAVLLSATANAGTIVDTDGTPAFTASSSATHTLTVGGGTGVVRATSSTFNGSVLIPYGQGAIMHPVYSGVTLRAGGITYAATMTMRSQNIGWHITSTNGVSPFTFSINTQDDMIVTATGLSGSLVVPSQSKSGSAGANSGANFIAGISMSGLTWTATGTIGALIGASGTNGSYTSSGNTVTVNGVNFVP